MFALVIAFIATAAVAYGLGRVMPAGGFFSVLAVMLLLFVALGLSVAVVALLVGVAGVDPQAATEEAYRQFPIVWIGGIIAFLNARRAAARAAERKAKPPPDAPASGGV